MSNTILSSTSSGLVSANENLETVVPLYRQLAARLREQIYKGEVEAGQQLPTEAELIARYRVSHITVRRAMQELTNEGLLIRTRGKGTFVNPSVFTGTYNYLFIHGLEMDGLAYPYTARLLNGISRQNSERVHFRLEMLALSPRTLQDDNEDRRVDDLLSHTKIHGIIALPRLRGEALKRLAGSGVFIVQIGMSEPPPPGVVMINFVMDSVLRQLARHLKQRGRTRIGLIAQTDKNGNSIQLEALHAAMNAEGLQLKDQAVEVAKWGINGGRDATRRLLQRCNGLDAIIASDDLQATGAILAAQEAGRNVGADLAIIGQGNLLGEHSHCDLTTVDLRIDDCGALAVQALERLLKGEKVDPIIPLEPKLIVRKTG